MKELEWLTAAEISAAYAARRLSPVELVQALLARIETHNPNVRRIHPRRRRGRARRRAPGRKRTSSPARTLGPLHGVPFGLKDNIDVAGLPTTCHSKILLDNIAREDAAGRRQPARGRRDHARQAVAARIRVRRPVEGAAVSVRAPSLEHRLSSRRIVVGLRRRARRGPRAAVDRHRRGRLDPQPGGQLRRRRAEADLRPGVAPRACFRSRSRSTMSARWRVRSPTSR